MGNAQQCLVLELAKDGLLYLGIGLDIHATYERQQEPSTSVILLAKDNYKLSLAHLAVASSIITT